MENQKQASRQQKRPALVLLTPGFAHGEEDTTCIPVMQFFVKSLKQQYPDLEVIVLAFQYPFASEEYLFHGVRVLSFNGRNRRKFFRLFLWVKVAWRLFGLHRRFRILGLLSFWMGECALVGSLFARCLPLKHVTWMLGQDARAGNPFFPLIRPRGADLVVLSDAMAREVHRHYGLLPGHMIPFGVDVSVFPEGGQRRTIDILGVGSLIPLKRFDLFVEVIRRLQDKFPGLKAVLCGKGPEKDRLLQLIDRAGLQQMIQVLDEVPHDRVLTLMQQSRVLVHPSAYEGFAAVFAEALYAGAHVVSFCQPLHRPIPHWHIAGNVEEMTAQLELLLKNRDLSHESVLPFTIEGACQEIMRLFGCQGGNQGC
ncbi:MAG: glycosyltransferase family 4 protein [Adhaeribacter sp.]